MNISRVLLVGSAVLSAGLLAPMTALACDDGTTYQGGGYTVTIGSAGDYYGCNSKQKCLSIGQYSHQSKGQYVWENKGTTYSMTPLAGKEGKYRFKVIAPNRRVLVSQVMKPM
jgi:hypothetical protein